MVFSAFRFMKKIPHKAHYFQKNTLHEWHNKEGSKRRTWKDMETWKSMKKTYIVKNISKQKLQLNAMGFLNFIFNIEL